ncbi:MAG TPA: type 4a pilus biogenesis protein PilO [Candidatus Cloacimonadota bacterium]|nr:type 4a pilus biogenesis protein PilO [Candidatus Cloacimonadota bacterium]
MKEKYLVFILIMILFTVLFFTVSSNMLASNLKQIRRYDTQIKTAQEKLNSSRIMEEQLSQFALIIDNSLTKSPSFSVDEINAFKTRIGEMAHQRAISITRMADSNKFSLPGLIETTYTLELEATYVQVGQFISDIEAMDNLIKIHSLDISPIQTNTQRTNQTGGPNRYRVTIELSIFKVKQEA